MRNKFFLVVLFIFGFENVCYSQVERDDLRRGVSVVRTTSPLYSKPDLNSATTGVSVNPGERPFILGLSLDGHWAQVLTRSNKKGWVPIDRVYRLPRSDSRLETDYKKLVERSHWKTSRLALSLGLYTNQDILGELAFTILPRGLWGLKGESLDIVLGITKVKATENLKSNFALRGLVQWPFRMTTQGNLHIGPRIGIEMKDRFNPVGIEPVERANFLIMGLLLRYMPSDYLGFSLTPEFAVHSKVSTFSGALSATLMF
jgi:hypothetical protein